MRADRLLSILMLLQARGKMTAQELAEELEVSERTVYRDLEALSASGVPVLTERGPGGGVTLPAKYRTDLTGLTESEVRGLFMSIMPGTLTELGMGKAIEAAMRKLAAALPAVQRQGAERVRGLVHVDTAQWFRPAEEVYYLKLLQEAVWGSLHITMRYQASSGARSRFFVSPYGLVAKAGVWYLVGASLRERRVYGVANVKEARQDIATFRVSRIITAELTDESFQRPANFDLASYWTAWCAEFEANLPRYHALLRVAPDMLPILPTIYGEGVRKLIAEAGPPDAEGWITLSMAFENFDAARTSILGLGTGAEVIEPIELREGVVRAAAGVVAAYVGGTARNVIERAGDRAYAGTMDDRQ